MKIKITVKGYHPISTTVAIQTLETCVMPQNLELIVGRLLYTFEQSGFAIPTNDVYVAFMRNMSKVDLNMLTYRYLPILNNTRFGDMKVSISLAAN
jgi:hypothetical protein